jgi:hypothetical protein
VRMYVCAPALSAAPPAVRVLITDLPILYLGN